MNVDLYFFRMFVYASFLCNLKSLTSVSMNYMFQLALSGAVGKGGLASFSGSSQGDKRGENHEDTDNIGRKAKLVTAIIKC